MSAAAASSSARASRWRSARSCRFDFQLQDAAPLMAGEGTVVWIRENDPTRAGVTPGMGVRFDKLTPTSQPVLDCILADKSQRDQSGLSMPGTSSKVGAGIAVRRPSSTFSAVDPAILPPGTPAGLGIPESGPNLAGAAASSSGSTLPFGLPAAPADLLSGRRQDLRLDRARPGRRHAGLRPPSKDFAGPPRRRRRPSQPPTSAAPAPGSGAGASSPCWT